MHTLALKRWMRAKGNTYENGETRRGKGLDKRSTNRKRKHSCQKHGIPPRCRSSLRRASVWGRWVDPSTTGLARGRRAPRAAGGSRAPRRRSRESKALTWTGWGPRDCSWQSTVDEHQMTCKRKNDNLGVKSCRTIMRLLDEKISSRSNWIHHSNCFKTAIEFGSRLMGQDLVLIHVKDWDIKIVDATVSLIDTWCQRLPVITIKRNGAEAQGATFCRGMDWGLSYASLHKLLTRTV